MVMDRVGKELRDKDDFKSEKDLGSKKSEFLLLKKRKVSANERHLVVETRSTATDTIWGRFNWGDADWDGSYDNEFEISRVINPNRKYIDNLYSTYFIDTGSSTATLDTSSGEISFGTSQSAVSSVVFTNNETISSATLTSTETGSGSVDYYLSANSGSNWESVTSGTSHSFTNQGEYLMWKATGSDKAIQQIKIEY